jgi:protein-tyrosine-phosphatase
MTDKPGVLFVCMHNAGRSQMAAALLSRLPLLPRSVLSRLETA